MSDFLILSFDKLLLRLEWKLLFDTFVLRLDILLFSNEVLMAFQNMDLNAVQVCTFLVTQPADEDVT